MSNMTTAMKEKILKEALRAQEAKMAAEFKGLAKETPEDYDPEGGDYTGLDLDEGVEMFKVPGDEAEVEEEDKVDEDEDDFASANSKIAKQLMEGKEGDALIRFKDRMTKKRKPVESFSYKGK